MLVLHFEQVVKLKSNQELFLLIDIAISGHMVWKRLIATVEFGFDLGE